MDFVTLSKKEEGVCQDLCLFLCTSIAAESSHVYVCQIFSSTFLHLCWQPTALLQLLQSLKPAAALAGLPFLMPPLHLLSLPLPSPPFLSLFLFLSRLKAYSHQTWLGSKKRQRLNFKGRLQVCYTHTHTHFLLISNNQAPVLKTGYFSALSYCQNPPNQTSFMQGRQQYKSRQPQSTRMHIHCHFRPWDVALWLLPAKSRFKVMTLRVKWQTNPFRSVSPKEG